MQGGGAFVRGLVIDEINALVAEAAAAGRQVSVAECVAKVRLLHPACELTDQQIADEIGIVVAGNRELAKPGRTG